MSGRRSPAPWWAALAVVAAAACATYSERTQLARDAAQAGDIAGSEKVLNKFLGTRSSADLPNDWKKETIVALLERSMVLHAKGDWRGSAKDMVAADKELVLLDIGRDAGQVGKWIFSDSSGKYHAPPSEKLALNAINMLNYVLADDLSGARVEAKRFTITREYLGQLDAGQAAHGAFGSYIAGFVFERLGEVDTALRYYDEALQEQPFPSLRAPIARLAARSSFRSPRIDELLATQPAAAPADPTQPAATSPSAPAPGEILVVMNLGRVPYKAPERMPIGLAVGMGAAYITGSPAVLEHSALKFVIYPELVPSGALFSTGQLVVDGVEWPLELATNLDAEIVREYDTVKPKIIGAAITRMIVRAAVAEGARAAGNQAKDGAGAIVGLLAALAAEGAMVAADKPDTRSWTLLPAFVFVARVPVAPGQHRLGVTAMGSGGREHRDISVDVKPGGFAVVDVTTLR
jgi:hypothetical protein